MKILHLLSTHAFSGAENVCINLMKIVKENHDVYYVSVDGSIKEVLNKHNLTFVPLNKFNYRGVRNAIKKIKPDIIHAHDIRASVYGATCSVCPVISHIHGNFADMSRLTLKSLLYRFFAFRFKIIFFVSKSIKEEFFFQRILEKKGIFLPNRINEKDIEDRLKTIVSDKEYDVICIGRLEEQKDPLKFLETIEILQKTRPNTTACLVGAGSMRGVCEETVKRKGITVEITGYQEEPLMFLKKSKILLITSKREGLPMVALEAIACKKPIVTTPTDGMVEIIKSGFNGYIADTSQELSNCCLKLLENNWEYDKMVKNIKKNCLNDFTKYKDTVLAVYMKIFNELRNLKQ